MKIGILKETKIPVDRRVPLVPEDVLNIREKHKGVEVVAQTSDIRVFKDQEYLHADIPVADDVSDCDILLGVKEVEIKTLVPDKTYLFFSHTIKEQPYNRDLLREILKRNIRLIDYEVLTDDSGARLIAFGRYAGIVGAYNAILTLGRRYNLFHIKRAHECFDLLDLQKEFSKVHLPPLKVALTGGGRVAKGSIEVLTGMGIRKVTPSEFLNENFEFPVFTQLNARDYNHHVEGSPFTRSEFYTNPESYEGTFLKFASKADILISGAYWDPKAPVLFTREDVMREDFKIRVIADITCDIEGSIPSTKKASTIEDPFYDFNPSENTLEAPFSDEANLTVMAVDNLPGELPRDSSMDFSHQLTQRILPLLLNDPDNPIIQRATITDKGKLTDKYKYLTNYVEGK